MTGTIDSGTVTLKQNVSISSVSGRQIVDGIELFDKQLDTASIGDTVGILFTAITKEQVSQGDIVSD